MYTPYGHIDKPLSNLASRYTYPGAIARMACPVITEGVEESGKYPIFGNEELVVRSDAIGDRTEANEVKWYVTWGYYQTQGHALRGFVPARLLKSAEKAVAPRTTTTLKVKEALDILREVRLAALWDATVGTTSMDSGDKTNAWATASSGTPLTDIAAAKQAFKAKTGRAPNTIVMADDVEQKLVACDEYTDRVKYVQQNQLATYDELVNPLAKMRVLIASQQYVPELLSTTSAPATRPTTLNVWGDNVYLAWINPRPSLYDASCCYELMSMPETVRTIPEPKWGIGGGEWIQCEYMSTQKMINSYLLYRIQNVI